MVLNASYMCLHIFSLRQESPDPDSERWTPHFYGGSVTSSLTLILHHHAFPNPHPKYLTMRRQ
jgi:hypothetical protein